MKNPKKKALVWASNQTEEDAIKVEVEQQFKDSRGKTMTSCTINKKLFIYPNFKMIDEDEAKQP